MSDTESEGMRTKPADGHRAMGTASNVVVMPQRRDGPPFSSAALAWFWAFKHIRARRAGMAIAAGSNPDDIVKALDRLYRERRVGLNHARVMRIWGEIGHAPRDWLAAEKADAMAWREAMEAMDAPLRVIGIVLPPADTALRALVKGEREKGTWTELAERSLEPDAP